MSTPAPQSAKPLLSGFDCRPPPLLFFVGTMKADWSNVRCIGNGIGVVEYFAMIAAWVGDKDLACEQLAIAVRPRVHSPTAT
jgi:hypothetical protein